MAGRQNKVSRPQPLDRRQGFNLFRRFLKNILLSTTSSVTPTLSWLEIWESQYLFSPTLYNRQTGGQTDGQANKAGAQADSLLAYYGS